MCSCIFMEENQGTRCPFKYSIYSLFTKSEAVDWMCWLFSTSHLKKTPKKLL